MKRPCLFLDRDGTLNRDTGYVFQVAAWQWLPGAREACRLAHEAGAALVVVTNQSGIARGLYGHYDVATLHEYMTQGLRDAGAELTAAYYCPHHPSTSACLCRKPHRLLFERALARFELDATRSLMLGDTVRDLLPAHQLGLHTAWVRNTEQPTASSEHVPLRTEILTAWPTDVGFAPWRTIAHPDDYVRVVQDWLRDIQ